MVEGTKGMSQCWFSIDFSNMALTSLLTKKFHVGS
jgi:hypothetical protein